MPGSGKKELRPGATTTAIALLIFLALVALMPWTAFASGGPVAEGRLAQEAGKSWDFERFDSDIRVNTDSSFTVRETQIYNFQGSFSYVNRFIPTTTAGFGEGRTCGSVVVKDIEVYTLEGEPYDGDLWSTESEDEGVNVHIDFSATDEQMGWIIEYRMKGAIIFADDYDRLYWNTVSLDRDVPIRHSRVTTVLPEGTDMEQVEVTYYVDQDDPPAGYDFRQEGDRLIWEASDIPPATTTTIDVAFPKGIVQPPVQYRGWFGYLMVAISSAVGLFALAWMLVLWWREGRDTGRADLVPVNYEPPEGMKPAMVDYLVHQGCRTEGITATLVDLAIRGKLTIVEEKTGILKKKEYSFERGDTGEADLLPYEKEVLDALFESGKEFVTQDDLKHKFYTHISDISEDVGEQVMSMGLFKRDPAEVKSAYNMRASLLVVPAVIVALLWIWLDIGSTWYLIPGFIFAALCVSLVGRYMPSRTRKGSQALAEAMGFKEYMSTAEREEMKLMTPENFQENLPYAMVLDVADEWAGKFENIYTSPPEWYRGSYTTFSTVYLAGSLSGMSKSVGHTMTSSPSSAGGGGGFGGGSAGGGFGGGGSSAG